MEGIKKKLSSINQMIQSTRYTLYKYQNYLMFWSISCLQGIPVNTMRRNSRCYICCWQ